MYRGGACARVEKEREREREGETERKRDRARKCGLESLNLCAKSALRNENGENKN
jgi:hypothetical protein